VGLDFHLIVDRDEKACWSPTKGNGPAQRDARSPPSGQTSAVIAANWSETNSSDDLQDPFALRAPACPQRALKLGDVTLDRGGCRET